MRRRAHVPVVGIELHLDQLLVRRFAEFDLCRFGVLIIRMRKMRPFERSWPAELKWWQALASYQSIM